MILRCLHARYVKDSLSKIRKSTRTLSGSLLVVKTKERFQRCEVHDGVPAHNTCHPLTSSSCFMLKSRSTGLNRYVPLRRLYSGYSKFALKLERQLLCSGSCSAVDHKKISLESSLLHGTDHVEEAEDFNCIKGAEETLEPTRKSISAYLHFHPSCSSDTRASVSSSFEVINDFVTEDEEAVLMKEVEPHLKRLKYEFDHWDDAIHGFRETERSRWGKASSSILSRMRQYAFPSVERQLPQTHVLDLEKTGVIKPHVDSVRFCGNVICGLSLLSDAVMRLVHVEDKDQVIDIILRRRSLYVMKDESRYKYTHEVLGEKESCFDSEPVPRERRVSIICRNYPREDGY